LYSIDKKGLRERLKQVYRETGFNKSEFASELGYSNATIGRWLSGETENIERTKRKEIADTFHISLKWLETGEGEMKLNGNATDMHAQEAQEKKSNLIALLNEQHSRLDASSQVDTVAGLSLEGILSDIELIEAKIRLLIDANKNHKNRENNNA
jgi:transcriptional regulator with XRE-family HTH domain